MKTKHTIPAWTVIISGFALILLSPFIAPVLFLRVPELAPEGIYTPGEYLLLLVRPAFNLTDSQVLLRMLPFVVVGVICIFFGVYCPSEAFTDTMENTWLNDRRAADAARSGFLNAWCQRRGPADPDRRAKTPAT